ncbi:Disulfide oxidoreductase YuzD [Bhargavaea ginsengi]|uniref:Disulfide oxidoreductase YuzD n=1 Tax=Bhargavaea ginsengi TaxID=426757 RepID=A0A1H7C1F2_9BACL|nr:YuzD family protein [Bhargavaea ginsengi]MCM3087702.1 YuzD family protein [Bhargavaea ginsengi]SEJ83531.1 Disulfide oxidoreductase YuzD [Bhargavaea ginsengi]
MNEKGVSIEVYGADIICASCVNAPSSKDTYEWLEAAISRKYPDHSFQIDYIDIEQPIEDPVRADIAARVKDDEFFYPLVMVGGEVVGEGYIQLKPVFKELEKHGFTTEA